jgi:hypothetical protein
MREVDRLPRGADVVDSEDRGTGASGMKGRSDRGAEALAGGCVRVDGGKE